MKSFQNRNDIIQLAFSEVTPTVKLELDSHWAAGSGNGLVETDTAEAKAPCSPTEHPQSSEDRKVLTTTVPGKRTKYFAQSPRSLVEVFIYKSQFRKHLASRCLPSLGFPGGSAVKNPPVYSGDTGSLGLEDPLEKRMATHSSIPAWRSQWTEKPGRLQSMGSQRIGHDSATKQQNLPSLLPSTWVLYPLHYPPLAPIITF